MLFKTNIQISQLIMNGLIDEAEELIKCLNKGELEKILKNSIKLAEHKFIDKTHKECMILKINLIKKYL